MSGDTSEFFDTKDSHPWSRVKDRILGSYVNAYLGKVSNWSKSILIIDAFAGPGKTQDGEPGSPLIICKAAERYVKGKYLALFVNNRSDYHNQLTNILKAGGYEESTLTWLGDGPSVLANITPLLADHSVFLYIDPFGLDCEFDILRPFLDRDKHLSTDILINLQVPILHRLAGRDAMRNGTIETELLERRHEKLSRALGGDYWKNILLSDLETKARERKLLDGYKKMLASTHYLTYTGSCPVQESRSGATKYFMVCASRHPDALVICDDAMCNAFNEYIHEREMKDTLFEDQPWQSWRDTSELESLVTQYVSEYPGETRKTLWVHIIREHFMRFTHSEYIKVVSSLVATGKIVCLTSYPSAIRSTKRLNNDCVLAPLT